MAKLLYVTCDLKPAEHSRCLIVGSEFLNEYLKWNPEDEIHMLDLYRDYIQRTDADVLNGLEKIRSGHHFATLTPDEQRKICRVWKLIDQFALVDKYVFVTPMCNQEFPEELRMYIDTVYLVSKAYEYTPREHEMPFNNQGKKSLLIHSAGGFDSGKKMACNVSYIRFFMNFLGSKEFETITIKETDAIPEKTRKYIEIAIQRAREFAVRF